MAAGVTEYGARVWLEVMFGRRAAPPIYYVALLTADADPGMTGATLSGVEVPVESGDVPVSTGYGRKSIGSGPNNWGPGDGGHIANAIELAFGNVAEDWGNVVGWGLTSASSGGELYAFGDFVNPRYVATGDGFAVQPGQILLAMTGPET